MDEDVTHLVARACHRSDLNMEPRMTDTAPTSPSASLHQASVDAADLRTALDLVCAAAGRRSTVPVLDDVFLRAQDGQLVLDGTDLTAWARASLPCEGPAEGVLADAATLAKVAKALPRKGPVQIEASSGALTIGGLPIARSSILARDYPCVRLADRVELERLGIVSGRALGDALGWVALRMSSDEARPHVACVHGDAEGLATTDGRALHHDSTVRLACPVLWPRGAVPAIARLAKAAGPAQILVSGGGTFDEENLPQVKATRFALARGGLTVELDVQSADAIFPPQEEIRGAAARGEHVVELRAGDLAEALAAFEATLPEHCHPILHADFGRDRLVLHRELPEWTFSREVLCSLAGEPINIVLHALTARVALRGVAAPDARITWRLTAPNDVMELRVSETRSALLMPGILKED